MTNRESFRKYEEMPKKFGWKYELFDGKTHASPWEIVIVYEHNLKNLNELRSNFTISDLKKDDLDSFVAAWLLAYHGADEFYGYAQSEIEDRAIRLFNDAISEIDNSNTILSGIVKNNSEDILGSIFITKTFAAGNPLVTGLFVIPEFQRKGIATSLLSYAANRLLSMEYGRLISYCQLSNDIGNLWHKKVGFRELPDLQIARMRRSYYSNELDRLDSLNELDEEEREVLSSKIAKWEKEINRLKKIEESQGFNAVHPLMVY